MRDAPEQSRPNRRRQGAMLVGGLAALGVLGACVVSAQKFTEAELASPTRYWTPADASAADLSATAEEPPSAPLHPLAAKLLPMPDGHRPGPDFGVEGNDYFVPGAKAVERLKEQRTGLSGAERKERDKALAQLKLKGVAARSYRDGNGMVSEISLMQADPKALGEFAALTGKLLGVVADKGSKPPTVDGFPQAKCWLLSIGPEDKDRVESLECVAVEGDHLVAYRAYEGKPLAVSRAVNIFRNQLTHLKSPGESA
ncbi:hypothetical protein DEJ50_15160 [Streptomyces venezuelae]|uniref:Secreted protein n=1 Tax=Streptomyces venezuelae TaxID=54571 RepID=A0A5P2DGN0_STRVZ|nr:hypothetical protein DEJ50_15160 [Streptomyces venezuelae]